jgi:type I restriction enzyme S subunit
MSNVAVKQENQEEWQFLRIKDIAHTTSGGTPKRGVAEYYNGDVPWIKSGDLNDSYLNACDEYITELGLEKSSAKLFKSGTLLIALYGATIGRLSILNFEASTNQAVCGISVPENVDVKYLFYYLLSIRQKLIDQGKGGAQPNINQQIVKETVVPLAPPEQQKRIVAKIEELFSHIDAGIEALKRAKQLLKQYRQSVLKAAVTGELTKEWREANKDKLEPASQLLERILKERRQKWEEQQLEQFKANGKMPKNDKWKEKYKESYCVYEEIGELPGEWCWATVDQLGEVQLGRQRSPKNRSKDYPTNYIRAANITEKGLDFTDLMDMEFKPDEFERYVMKANDLVLSEASGSPDQVGKPAIWREDMPECCFQNTVIRHRPYEVNPEYLLVHYKYFYWCQIFSKTAGGVGINHLSAQKFLKMSIALPAETEQKEIIHKVEERFDAISRMGEEIRAQLIKVEKNKQSILASAFSGRLNEVGCQLYGTS